MWIKQFIRYKNQRTPLRFLIVTIIFQQCFSLLFAKTFLGNTEDIEVTKDIPILSHGGGHKAAPGTPEFWWAIAVSTFCVMGAGFCSGLTVGYLSIDELDLQIAIQGNDEKKKKLAKNILPVIQQHHLLLSTLLVANALCMETLPIYLHKIFGALAAVLFSTFFVVIFGEIIPQAFCTGKNQLPIANFCIPLTKLLIIVFWIVCYPTAKLLDFVLGVDHKFLFPKSDLKALINIHKGNIFTHGQFSLMQSLFDLRTDNVQKQMVPFQKVFSLNYEEKITKELIKKVKAYGYTQIPIYQGNTQNIKYVMKAKRFLQCDSSLLGKSIKNRFQTDEILAIKKSASMLDMLMSFQQSKQTFAFIVDEVEVKSKPTNKQDFISGIQSQRYNSGQKDSVKSRYIGIITLKDVFEEILDQQLVDEDLHKDQQIEIEELKNEYKRIKDEKVKFEQEIQKEVEEENEDEIKKLEEKKEEHLRKVEELLELQKKLKSQTKKNKKQQQLIDNDKIKHRANLQEIMELKNMGSSLHKKDNNLEEPLINAREKNSI